VSNRFLCAMTGPCPLLAITWSFPSTVRVGRCALGHDKPGRVVDERGRQEGGGAAGWTWDWYRQGNSPSRRCRLGKDQHPAIRSSARSYPKFLRDPATLILADAGRILSECTIFVDKAYSRKQTTRINQRAPTAINWISTLGPYSERRTPSRIDYRIRRALKHLQNDRVLPHLETL